MELEFRKDFGHDTSPTPPLSIANAARADLPIGDGGKANLDALHDRARKPPPFVPVRPGQTGELFEAPPHWPHVSRPIIIYRFPGLSEELEALERLDRENTRNGADLHQRSYEIAKHQPELLRHLEESDALLEAPDLKGRSYLMKRRRRGILRILNGSDRGFPVFAPVPPPGAKEPPWLLRLRDEMEWPPIALRPRGKDELPRPMRGRLTSTDARAILDAKAAGFERRIKTDPTLIAARIDPAARKEIIFETEAFMAWVEGLAASSRN